MPRSHENERRLAVSRLIVSTFENSRNVEVPAGDEHEHGLFCAPDAARLRHGCSLASGAGCVFFCRYPATFHVSGIPETWKSSHMSSVRYLLKTDWAGTRNSHTRNDLNP